MRTVERARGRDSCVSASSEGRLSEASSRCCWQPPCPAWVLPLARICGGRTKSKGEGLLYRKRHLTVGARSSYRLTMERAPPTVQRCPNCGAPLKLDPGGDCHFCHVHVNVADVDEPDDDDESGDADPFHEDEADALIARLALDDYDPTLPQPVPSILAVLRYAASDGAARRFLEAPSQVVSVRALAQAVRTIGQRVAAAHATNDDAFHRGEKLYTPDEWWTFDLAADFLVALGSFDGIERAVKADLAAKAQFIDKHWAGILRKMLKHVGDGPVALRSLRLAVPRRPRS